MGSGDRFRRIARSDDRHVWNCAHDRDVLLRVVSTTQRGIGYSASNAHKPDWEILITTVHTYLFKRAVDRECSDGIGERNAASQCESRSHTDHRYIHDLPPF